MPASQRGQAYRLGPNRWGLRYYDADGTRRRKSPFATKSAALAHYRDIIEPQLRGDPTPAPDLTLSDFVPLYLERHAVSVRRKTMATLKERLAYATNDFGSVPLRDLERMAGEIAAWETRLPERSRYGITGALRQALGAAVRWGYIRVNPAALAGPRRQPTPRSIRTYNPSELAAISAELPARYASLPLFAASTGLRPEEWQALERRHIDRKARLLNILRTASDDGIVELAKTSASRRQVPLSMRALEALDSVAPRLDTTLVFPGQRGGVLNLDNFRRRMWAPAIAAAGIETPARIYDLRSTFASDALAAGISAFELARILGTSVRMIERHYGALLDGAGAGIAGRLDAFDALRGPSAASI